MAENKFRLPRPASVKLRSELTKRAISERAAAIIEGLFAQWDADPRIVVDRKTSQAMNSIGPTYQIILEGRGELDAIESDGRIRVFVDGIYARLIRRAVETYPAGGAQKKAKPIPVNLIKARDERVKAARKRVLERELAAAPSKRSRSQTKKPSELPTTPAE